MLAYNFRRTAISFEGIANRLKYATKRRTGNRAKEIVNKILTFNSMYKAVSAQKKTNPNNARTGWRKPWFLELLPCAYPRWLWYFLGFGLGNVFLRTFPLSPWELFLKGSSWADFPDDRRRSVSTFTRSSDGFERLELRPSFSIARSGIDPDALLVLSRREGRVVIASQTSDCPKRAHAQSN